MSKVKRSQVNSENRAFWKAKLREAPLLAINKIENAAQQLIALVTFVQTAYFAILYLSHANQSLEGWSFLFVILPFLCWLGSLFFAVRVIFPRRYEGEIKLKDLPSHYKGIRDKKYHQLQLAYSLFLASLVLVQINAGLFLLF